jgi:hypothetical protein
MAAYTLAQLLTFFREDLDDTATPYLWSDSNFYRYLDEAQKQFARDTRYFRDSASTEMTRVPVSLLRNYVDIDERILEITRAQLTSNNRPLQILNFNELDHHTRSGDSFEQWEITSWSESTGTPRHLVLDHDNNRGRLVPAPVADDTLLLWVIRDPLDDIDDADSCTEVEDRNDQLTLLHYVKYLAYSKQDADVVDPNRASNHLAEYRLKTEETRQRLNKKRHRPGTVRYGGL